MNKIEKFVNYCKAKLILKEVEIKMNKMINDFNKKCNLNDEGTFTSNVGDFEYYRVKQLVTEITGVSILKHNGEIISSYKYEGEDKENRDIFNVDKIIELKDEFDREFKKLENNQKIFKTRKPKL